MIGGGPAGLAAAIVCATHGVRTALFERHTYPIDKPCGEGLLPNGVAALRGIGIQARSLAPDARPIAGIRYHSSQGRTAEALFSHGSGLGIRRRDLSKALISHAQTLDALEIVAGQPAAVTLDDLGRPLVCVSGTTLRPKLVIGADGLHSRIRSSVGIGVEQRGRQRWGCRQHFSGAAWDDRVEVYFERGFEVYVTPVPEGVNISVLWDARVVQPPAGSSPVVALAGRVPRLTGRLVGRTPIDRARAAGPFDVRVRQPWRSGVLLVGDAAGYVDALTGEGVGVALEQAALLAQVIVPALALTPTGDLVSVDALRHFAAIARVQSRWNRRLSMSLVRIARYPVIVERLVAALASNTKLFAHLLDLNMGRRGMWPTSAP